MYLIVFSVRKLHTSNDGSIIATLAVVADSLSVAFSRTSLIIIVAIFFGFEKNRLR